MMAQVPGVVHGKEYTNTEESENNIMKRGQIQIEIDSETLPDTIIPKGLDAARQWYLYDEIRPYCKNTFETLTSCCKPAIGHVQNLAKSQMWDRQEKVSKEVWWIRNLNKPLSWRNWWMLFNKIFGISVEGRLKFPSSSSSQFPHSYCLYRNEIAVVWVNRTYWKIIWKIS